MRRRPNNICVLPAWPLENLHEGTFDFVCQRGQEVYDHVMNSGAGTTFYFSLQPSARERLAAEFVRRIDQRYQGESEIRIVHRYIVGISSVATPKLLGQRIEMA